MDLGQKLLDIAKKNIDVPGIVDAIMTEVLKEALAEAVKKSETPIDDAVVALLYPPLETLVKQKVREAWSSVVS